MPKKPKPNWKPRYISWREGRPRFEPGPRERRLGFTSRDLRHGETGPWFTMEETRSWGEANLVAIRAARAGEKPPVREERGESVKDLVEAYTSSMDFRALGLKTQADQRRLMAHILWEKPKGNRGNSKTAPRPEKRTLISRAPARFIEPADVKGFFEKLVRERSLHAARAIIMLLSAAYRWGRTSTGWRLAINPCHRLNLPSPEPRVFVWSEGMITAMVAAADALQRPEIGDAIYMGVFTAQRLADRLELVDGGLVDGARLFRQNKTGAVVMIPEMPQLAARLAAAKERRRALPFKVIDATIVVDESTGRAFSPRHYNTIFNRVKAAAIKGIVDAEATAIAVSEHEAKRLNTEPPVVWLVSPCPELAEARDQDLRDTAVTWLALADCTLMQIAGITGHSIASIQTTIRHYLAMDPRLAGAAIGKLKRWMAKERMKL